MPWAVQKAEAGNANRTAQEENTFRGVRRRSRASYGVITEFRAANPVPTRRSKRRLGRRCGGGRLEQKDGVAIDGEPRRFADLVRADHVAERAVKFVHFVVR